MTLAQKEVYLRILQVGRKLRRWLFWCAHASGWLFLKVVGLALLAAGLWLLTRELVADKPQPGLVSTAGALVLIAALFARYGEDLASRIKKVGPVELFEEVREVLSAIDLIADEVPDKVQEEEKVVEPSAEERFSFERGNLYATTLMAMDKEPGPKHRDRATYFKLLFKLGRFAYGQKNLPLVVARLERLYELSEGSYLRDDVLLYLGVAHCRWGSEIDGKNDKDKATRRHHFGKANKWLHELARDGDPRPRTYFYLAYAQDELGYWHEAVGSNAEAIKRNPRYAKAKYNTAISWAKLGNPHKAIGALEALRPNDDEIDEILDWYEKDPELEVLLEHPCWGPRARSLMLNLTRKWTS